LFSSYVSCVKFLNHSDNDVVIVMYDSDNDVSLTASVIDFSHPPVCIHRTDILKMSGIMVTGYYSDSQNYSSFQWIINSNHISSLSLFTLQTNELLDYGCLEC